MLMVPFARLGSLSPEPAAALQCQYCFFHQEPVIKKVMQGKGQELRCAEHILETAPQGSLAFLPPCLAERMIKTSCLNLSFLFYFPPPPFIFFHPFLVLFGC